MQAILTIGKIPSVGAGYTMLKKLLKYAAHLVAPRYATGIEQRLWFKKQAILLQKRCADCADLDSLVDEVLLGQWFLAAQKKTEIRQLLSLLRELRPKIICEIGTQEGGTLCLFCQIAAPNARILSIDIHYTPERRAAFPRLARPGQEVTCLMADSHSPRTVETVRNWLGGGQFDFLFIDGDHSIAGVTSDFEMYSPFVREGGIIAFHDIVPDHRTRFGKPTSANSGQVPEFWSELKGNRKNTVDMVEDPVQDGFGIGVVHWGNSRTQSGG